MERFCFYNGQVGNVSSNYIHISVFTEHAEADTFFCFTALMAEIGDMFTKKLDSAHLGIGMNTYTCMCSKEYTCNC